jgi:hypothetical protein
MAWATCAAAAAAALGTPLRQTRGIRSTKNRRLPPSTSTLSTQPSETKRLKGEVEIGVMRAERRIQSINQSNQMVSRC